MQSLDLVRHCLDFTDVGHRSHATVHARGATGIGCAKRSFGYQNGGAGGLSGLKKGPEIQYAMNMRLSVPPGPTRKRTFRKHRGQQPS